jgi:hypothetical protein
MNLSDDEITILMIAAQGESMMAIAHWKAPVESLIQKGYLQSRGGDNFNCVITEAGRAACKDDATFKAMIEAGSIAGSTKKVIRDHAEQAAQLLAKAARASHSATGDAPEYAVEKWSAIILRRALELLRA